MFCPESRTHVKLSSMVGRDFSMQELLITLYAENNYFDKFLNFYQELGTTTQTAIHMKSKGSRSSHPMNGPASLSENSIFELELTPSTTSPRKRGGAS